LDLQIEGQLAAAELLGALLPKDFEHLFAPGNFFSQGNHLWMPGLEILSHVGLIRFKEQDLLAGFSVFGISAITPRG